MLLSSFLVGKGWTFKQEQEGTNLSHHMLYLKGMSAFQLAAQPANMQPKAFSWNIPRGDFSMHFGKWNILSLRDICPPKKEEYNGHLNDTQKIEDMIVSPYFYALESIWRRDQFSLTYG